MDLPVKKIIILSLSVLVLIVVAVFFLINFSRAGGDVNIGVNHNQTSCQALCQSLLSRGFNFDSCNELMSVTDSIDYAADCEDPCSVTIKNAVVCVIQ